MSKELLPLEALDNLRYGGLVDGNVVCFTKLAFEKRLDIIETALKDYERKLKLAKEYEDVNNVAKRLKALEIIKKKKVNVRFLISCKTLKEYNDVISDHLTQEEYDLLKEVLL